MQTASKPKRQTEVISSIWLRACEARALTGLSLSRLRNLAKSGKVHAARTSERGHRLYSAADVHRLAAELKPSRLAV